MDTVEPDNARWFGGSPGYSLEQALRNLSRNELIDLIGREFIETLQSVDSTTISTENLVHLGLRVLDERDWLLEDRKRHIVVQAIPLPKAEELLGRLGRSNPGPDPFDALEGFVQNPTQKELRTILGFFGVRQSHSGNKIAASPTTEEADATPEFGLFHHQRITAQQVSEALEESRTVLLHMPTGSGKTRTAMHLLAEHLRKRDNGLVIWLSEQPEVLNQAFATFHKAWSHLGNRTLRTHQVYGSNDLNSSAITTGFAVGGFQKLHAALQRDTNDLLSLGDRATMVVVDEAHQAIAPTYNSVIRALARKGPTTRLLGLTATPGRTWSDISEDYRLSEFFDGTKVTLVVPDNRGPIRYLVEEGYLANATFRHVDISKPLNRSDFSRLQSLDNAKLLELLLDVCQRHNRILLFADSVEHARLIGALLEYKGVAAPVVIAETPEADRQVIFRKFRRPSTDPMVVVNYGVLTTGFDAPAASAAVIARRTRSLVLFSQMVGRVLRGPRAGGTENAEVLTTVDTELPGFGSVSEAFTNWEDVWDE